RSINAKSSDAADVFFPEDVLPSACAESSAAAPDALPAAVSDVICKAWRSTADGGGANAGTAGCAGPSATVAAGSSNVASSALNERDASPPGSSGPASLARAATACPAAALPGAVLSMSRPFIGQPP